MQGASLMAGLATDFQNWRRAVVVENFEQPEGAAKSGKKSGQAAAHVLSRSVRDGRHKLILRDGMAIRATALRELYDLESDPGERTNLYGPGRGGVIERLLRELEAWAETTDDPPARALAAACRADCSPGA